ncbi:MAG: trypsin-like peptidase domain-containing protein [Nannocystaceae bacterium]
MFSRRLRRARVVLPGALIAACSGGAAPPSATSEVEGASLRESRNKDAQGDYGFISSVVVIGADRSVALIDPGRVGGTAEVPEIKTRCLSRWGEGKAEWCDGQPPFDGPRIGLGSGVSLSDEWVLTTAHGLVSAAEGRLPRVVGGLARTPVDTTGCSTKEKWTLPAATVLEISEVHCIVDRDLALLRIKGGVPSDDWDIGVSSTVVGKLREGKLERVRVVSQGFPLGVPMASVDGWVTSDEHIDGGFESTVDDYHGSSGSMVLDMHSGGLIGIIVGATDAGTGPGNHSGCYRLAHNNDKVENARVELVDLDDLDELKNCTSEGCLAYTTETWQIDKACR